MHGHRNIKITVVIHLCQLFWLNIAISHPSFKNVSGFYVVFKNVAVRHLSSWYVPNNSSFTINDFEIKIRE